LQFYIAEEPFCDFNEGELNKNRLYSGIDFKATKNLKAGIYYILKSSRKNNNWSDVNVLVTTLECKF